MVQHWSREEVTYLEDKWGVVSIKGIAKHLGRSISAVKQKGQRLGLGDPLLSAAGITLSQLAVALNIHYGIAKNWVKTKGLPSKSKVFVEELRVQYVRYEDFWEWAEQNKNLINLARLEDKALGPEPQWAREKRKADMANYNKLLKRPWSKDEDSRLIGLVNAHRYTYPEIAKILRRTESAIKRRLHDLGSKARPVSLQRGIKWTEEETSILLDLLDKGYGFNTIAERLKKSEFSCRQRLEIVQREVSN